MQRTNFKYFLILHYKDAQVVEKQAFFCLFLFQSSVTTEDILRRITGRIVLDFRELFRFSITRSFSQHCNFAYILDSGIRMRLSPFTDARHQATSLDSIYKARTRSLPITRSYSVTVTESFTYCYCPFISSRP